MAPNAALREVSLEASEIQCLLEAFREEMRQRYVDVPTVREQGAKEPVTPEGLRAPDGRFFGLYEGEAVVACGGLRLAGGGVAEIKRMYVKPERRGRGYGRRMLAALEDAALMLGCRRLRLDTGPRQAEARTLYLSSGYEPVPAYNDLPEETFWAEKALTAPCPASARCA